MAVRLTSKSRLGRAAQVVAHHWGRRRYFGDIRSWLFYQYDWLLNRFGGVRLPLRRRPVAVRLRRVQRPMFVRLGTTDFHVLEEIYFDDEYVALVAGAPADVRTVLDLGSNIGLSLRLWLERFPGATVVGVEPDEGNHELCVRNARVVDPELVRTRVIRACVAGEAGTVALDRSGGEWAIRMETAAGVGQGGSVRALTVQQVLAEAGVEGGVEVVKCDIEGAERGLMKADTGWLRGVRLMAIELHAPYGVPEFCGDLSRAGGMRVRRVLKQMEGVSVLLVAPEVGGEPDAEIAGGRR